MVSIAAAPRTSARSGTLMALGSMSCVQLGLALSVSLFGEVGPLGVVWLRLTGASVILLAVVSDSGAYFVGRYAGKTPLAPSVSPNKTVEGAEGGLIATIVAGAILYKMMGLTWSFSSVLLFAATVSILAQLGDLAGSALKRAAGVKDSGWIFPGHGGLLDRTCSLVFALVFAYYWNR